MESCMKEGEGIKYCVCVCVCVCKHIDTDNSVMVARGKAG